MGKPPLRLFISYSFEDYAAISKIRTELHKAGHRTWMAPEDVKAGPWPPQIAVAIRECDLFVLALSTGSRESVMVQNEVVEAHKRDRPMIIVRLEPGVDFGEWGPVLNVWQAFDWVDSQIPRILQEIAAIPRPTASPPHSRLSIASATAAVWKKRRNRNQTMSGVERSIVSTCVLLSALCLGYVLFVLRPVIFNPPPPDSVQTGAAPSPLGHILLSVLPGPEESTHNEPSEMARLCAVLRPPLRSALEPATKLTFLPSDGTPENLDKFAHDVFTSKENLFAGLDPFVRSAACIALYPQLLSDPEDTGQSELFVCLEIRESQGNFKKSLKWLKFSMENRQRFRGSSNELRWLATRASVELARFLVTEGIVPMSESAQAKFSDDLTAFLLEASLMQPSVRNSISADFLSITQNQSPQSRLECLLREIDAKSKPIRVVAALDRAKLEVKRNLRPFSNL